MLFIYKDASVYKVGGKGQHEGWKTKNILG